MNILKPVLIGLALSTSTLAMTGCGADAGEEQSSLGTIQMPLSVTTATGSYRLLNARITVVGDTTQTYNANSNDELLDLELDAGTYLVRLEDGWQLQEETEGGTSIVEGASLVSDNPITVTVDEFETTNIVFNFDASGIVIEFGRGDLSIGMNVGIGCDTRELGRFGADYCSVIPAMVVPDGYAVGFSNYSYNHETERGSGFYEVHECIAGAWSFDYGGGGSTTYCSTCESTVTTFRLFETVDTVFESETAVDEWEAACTPE